jgi:hypothetical protein
MPNGDGPWAKYAQPAAGPWAKYGGTVSTVASNDPLKTGKGMEAYAQSQARPAPRTLPSVAPEQSPVGGGNVQDAAIMSQTQRQYPTATSPKTIGTAVGSAVAGAATGGMSLLPRMAAQFAGGAAGNALGQVSTGQNFSPTESALTGAGLAAGEGILGAAGKLASKVDPLARINKVIGVTTKDVRVGSTPASLGEFNSIPARGLQQAGFTEKQLAKMNPLERVKSITEARNQVGQQLDEVLKKYSAPPANGRNLLTDGTPTNVKTINVQKVLDDTFKNAIPDKRLAKLTADRFQQILNKTGIKTPLSQLSPMEARTLQRELDEFANFSPEGTLKTFRDIATSLRRGISRETGKAVPESVALDRQYGDLAGATKAVRKQAAQYASTVPESKLRKILLYGAGAMGAGGIGAATEHFLSK